MEYKFNFEDKDYILSKENIEYFANDEENPIEDITEEKILEIMSSSEKVDFSKVYFNLACDNCKNGVEEKNKVFDFLGYNFYLYTKDNKFVISNIEKGYEGKTFERLRIAGEVDNSYLATINICKHCGEYSIEIEEFEI